MNRKIDWGSNIRWCIALSIGYFLIDSIWAIMIVFILMCFLDAVIFGDKE